MLCRIKFSTIKNYLKLILRRAVALRNLVKKFSQKINLGRVIDTFQKLCLTGLPTLVRQSSALLQL